MNNKQLRDILEKHSLWLKDKKDGCCADLGGADLKHADLSFANLRGANLHGARLHCANLHYVNLRDANLQDVNLSNADLRYTNLNNADLRGATFDFSCWPLWCGSTNAILDKRQKRQLLYHVLAVAPEYRTPELIKEANQFHRVETHEVPKLTLKETEK